MKIVRFDELTFIPARHEDPAAPGVWKKVLLEKQDFLRGAVQMVTWGKLPAGNNFRRHYHEDMQEIFVIVKGRARISVGVESAELGPGDAVVIPEGAEHEMGSREGSEYLVIGISAERGGRTVVV